MKIALDLEGVVAESNVVFPRVVAERYHVEAPESFQYQWNIIEAAKHALGVIITPKEHEELWAETWRRWKEIPEADNGSTFIMDMKEDGHDVTILTHSFSADIEEEKMKWIEKHLGRVPVQWVNGAKQKWECEFDVFIDDGPHNIVALTRNKKKVICYTRRWNLGLEPMWYWKRVQTLYEAWEVIV